MGWYEERRTKECIEGLQKVVDALDEKDRIINSLREKNKKLEDEHYKDKELKKLQEKIEELQGNCTRGFPITVKEQEKIDKIRKEHRKTCPLCKFSYEFVCYPMVDFGFLKCATCGEKIKFAEW